MPPRKRCKNTASARKNGDAADASHPGSDDGYVLFSKALCALRELTTATATVLDRKLHGVHCKIRERATKKGWGSTAADLNRAWNKGKSKSLTKAKYCKDNPQQWQQLYFGEFQKLHAKDEPVWSFRNSDAREWSSGPFKAASGAAAFRKFSEGGHVEMAKLFCAPLGPNGWKEKKTFGMLDPPALLAMICNCCPLKEMTEHIEMKAKAVSQLRNRLAHGLDKLSLGEEEYGQEIKHLQNFLQELLLVNGLNQGEIDAVEGALLRISKIDQDTFTMMSSDEVKRIEELATQLHNEQARAAQLAVEEAKEREKAAKTEEELHLARADLEREQARVKKLEDVKHALESKLLGLKGRVER